MQSWDAWMYMEVCQTDRTVELTQTVLSAVQLEEVLERGGLHHPFDSHSSNISRIGYEDKRGISGGVALDGDLGTDCEDTFQAP